MTRVAVLTRYPGFEPPTEEEYSEAVRIAQATVEWADALVRTARGE